MAVLSVVVERGQLLSASHDRSVVDSRTVSPVNAATLVTPD